jgi:hypothetical protein
MGRDAANGLFDAVHSLDCCADCNECFLMPAYAPYCEPQFRAAMMKRACHATGEPGSAFKIISIAAGTEMALAKFGCSANAKGSLGKGCYYACAR